MTASRAAALTAALFLGSACSLFTPTSRLEIRPFSESTIAVADLVIAAADYISTQRQYVGR